MNKIPPLCIIQGLTPSAVVKNHNIDSLFDKIVKVFKNNILKKKQGKNNKKCIL